MSCNHPGIPVFLIFCGLIITAGLAAQCSFSISDPAPCAGEAVDFSVDNPVSGGNYAWDLDGDGQTDLSGSSFTYAFPVNPIPTNYPVVLYADGDSCTTQVITVAATPDAGIGVPPGIVLLSGNELKACNGSSSFELEIYNASSTYLINESYTINWGDGSPAETFDNVTFSNTNTISHTYNGLGYYTIFVTVTSVDGCVFTENYTFYNGGNPSVGLVIPGNTVGLCAPATLDFPIINTESNPPGTEYQIFINGQEVAAFTQEELPPVFTYTFMENSCGAATSTGNYNNAFDIRIVASNPCNSSTATIEPIEVSEPPEPFFEVSPPAYSCEGASFTFTNATAGINEVISGNPSACIDVLNPNWTISGTSDDDWMLVSGNLFGGDAITVEFLQPGVFTIEMTVVSFACGPFTFSRTVTIFDPPAPVDGIPPIQISPTGSGDGCAPLDYQLTSGIGGDSLILSWQIDPPNGWEWIDSSQSPVIRFTEGGNFDVRLTAANPCSEQSWDTIFTVPGPPGISLQPLPDYCNDALISFDSTTLSISENGSSITQYLWTFPGGSPATDTVLYPQNVQYDTPGTYEVSLTAVNTCGEQTIRDTFTVQSPTALQLPPTATLCELDAPVALTAEPAGGSWSGSGVTGGNEFSPLAAGPGDHLLTYSYGVGACFVEAQVTFSVLPAPSMSVPPGISVCSNAAPVTLTGTPGNGSWSGASPGALEGNTFLPAAAGAGQYILTYTVMGLNGCGAADSMQVEVLAAPLIAAPDTSYCNTPGVVDLPAASPAGGQWSGPGVTDPAGAFDPFGAGGAGAYLLTYSVTAPNGCGAEEEVWIGVIDPANVNAGPDTTLCAGALTYDLAALAHPPGGSWRLNGEVLSGAELNLTALGGGFFQLTYQVGAGNCEVEDELSLTIIELDVSAGPPAEFCLDDLPVDLSSGSPAGGQWSGPGVTAGSFDPTLAQEGNHQLVYTFTDATSGCQQSAETGIVVHPLPTVAFSAPAEACLGESLVFDNQSNGATQFEWNFGDGALSSLTTPEHTYTASGNYTATLSARNGAGCVASLTQPVLIVTPPTAAFTPDAGQACGELTVQLSNQSTGHQPSFFWDLGNGQTSTAVVPEGPVQYESGQNDTTYLIRLQVTNLCGADTYQDTVEVLAFPQADFGFTVDTGCAPLTLEFANTSAGSPQEWYWDFGNGQTATDSLPEPQDFGADTAAVTYLITLVAVNSCGADTITRPLVVEPEEVQAFINTSNTSGCAPFDVTFASFSTPGTFLSWDTGDGNTFSGPAINHQFTAPGVYEVMLYADNTCAGDSASVYIEVLPAPEVSFTYSPNLCTGQEIEFTNTSSFLAGSTWQFGTGDTSALTNPVYRYENAGQYVVTLTGWAPGSGCQTSYSQSLNIGEPPQPAFVLDATEGCAPLTIQFNNLTPDGHYVQWDFGDGNTSVETSPRHTYLAGGHYPVRLRVFDVRGCYADSLYNDIFAFPSPEADFSILPDAACGLPVNVQFENTSTNADGFFWDLGEGLHTTLVNPGQVFTEPGMQAATLIASNVYGCRDTIRQSFQLTDQPVAEFDLDSLQGCQPLGVQFRNYSTGDAFYWDFGDGLTATEAAPFHHYAEAGTYQVSLIASYDGQCFDTLTLPGLVTVFPSPTAAFSWEEEDPNQPTGSLQFINLSEQATSFLWNFGDGTTTTELSPLHRYYDNGLWQVRLTAFNEAGCSDDTVAQIEPGFVRGLFVPNAFAPDYGAGDVRLFKPVGIGLKEYRLQIFSTYGQLLWETTELSAGRPGGGWDGTFNGEPLPQDVYVWKAQAVFEDGTEWRGMPTKNGVFQRMGSVTLLR